jgi:hypothetical protein
VPPSAVDALTAESSAASFGPSTVRPESKMRFLVFQVTSETTSPACSWLAAARTEAFRRLSGCPRIEPEVSSTKVSVIGRRTSFSGACTPICSSNSPVALTRSL